jgi:hypothetical protein
MEQTLSKAQEIQRFVPTHMKSVEGVYEEACGYSHCLSGVG